MGSSPARWVVIVLLIGPAALLHAAQTDDAPPPPPPPDTTTAPTPPPSEGPIEPEITITSKGNETHEEYRYKGVLYLVKVIPAHGPPYYLVYDQLGRARRSDLEPDIIVPQWVIKRF
jgi:Protein of unknown function (DUF2782)